MNASVAMDRYRDKIITKLCLTKKILILTALEAGWLLYFVRYKDHGDAGRWRKRDCCRGEHYVDSRLTSFIELETPIVSMRLGCCTVDLSEFPVKSCLSDPEQPSRFERSAIRSLECGCDHRSLHLRHRWK